MSTSGLNRFMIMSLMVMVTVVGLGKVSIPVFITTQQDGLSADMQARSPDMQVLPASQPVREVARVELPPVEDAWKVSWSASELIPSADAAESMALDEERDTRGMNDGEAARIIELREKQQQLLMLEKSLDERESEVLEAEKRARDKIAELESLEAKIQALLTEEQSIKDKKIKRLTAVYEGMKAERAAPVIAQMDLEIVVKIFSRMNEKQVGKILSFLPPQKAVVISQALTKRIAALSK